MLPIFSLLILALGVSLDGFSVGVTYGLRKIRIPLLSVTIISICSGLIVLSSMLIGAALLRLLPLAYTKSLGAMILIGVGIWALYQMKKNKEDAPDDGAVEMQAAAKTAEPTVRQIILIELNRLGIVIQIIKTPSAADMDKSGNISASEAAFLGIALSLDAFGAGIGAALIGFSPLFTSAVIALVSGSLLTMGLRVGYTYSNLSWIRKLAVLPGCILIMIGIMRFF